MKTAIQILTVLVIFAALMLTAYGCAEITETPATEAPVFENPVNYPDLDGVWKDADGNTVELIPTDVDEVYDVNVSIVRLSQFPGTGKLNVEDMELTLEDPCGGTIHAKFTPNEDSTCNLIITESNWNLLESDTHFDNFARVQ